MARATSMADVARNVRARGKPSTKVVITPPTPIAAYRERQQARISSVDRWRSTESFGSLDGPTLAAILQAADRGDTRKLCALIGYFLNTDDELASDAATRINRVVQADWVLKPGDETPEAEAARAFIEAVIAKIDNWQEGLRALLDAELRPLSAVEYAPLEFNAELNAFIPRELKHRDSARFQFDDQWQPRLYDDGRHKDGNRYGVLLHPGKWIVHYSPTHAGYPCTYGAVRALLWPLMFKRWAMKSEIMDVERFGSPFVAGEVGPNTPADVKEAFKVALQNMTIDGVIVMEEGTKIVDVPFTRSGEAPHGPYIDRINRGIAKRLLGTSDASSPGDTGSQSDATARVAVTMDPIMVAGGDALGETLRKQFFTSLLDWNLHLFGGKRPPVPVFRFKSHEDETAPSQGQGAQPQPGVGEHDTSPEFGAGDPLQPLRDFGKAPRPSARAGRSPHLAAPRPTLTTAHYARLRAALLG